MSGASPSPGVSSTAPPGGAFHRVREFWERISEGRQLDDLWSQFAADARAGYGFYGKDVDWDAIQKLPRWRRPYYVAKDIFWATLMKMTPARRVLLRSEEHTSELQSRLHLVCRLLLEKKKQSTLTRSHQHTLSTAEF